MLKSLFRSPQLMKLAGGIIALYVRFVARTTRWTVEPRDIRVQLADNLPVIVALWHGQHLFTPVAWPREWPMSALVARHADGEINAIALEQLGFTLIRGSGGHGKAKKIHRSGGVQALRHLVRVLSSGGSVSMTADVPKVGGVAGPGIAVLSKLSGRPIYPLAVVTRRSIAFESWDRARLSLPFGRGAVVFGDPLIVDAEADARAVEAARQEVGRLLDQAHTRAYELVGGAAWAGRNG